MGIVVKDEKNNYDIFMYSDVNAALVFEKIHTYVYDTRIMNMTAKNILIIYQIIDKLLNVMRILFLLI